MFTVDSLLDRLLADGRRDGRLTHLRELPQREGRTAPWPDWADPALVAGYRMLGVAEPWQHQADAAQAAWSGQHTVLSTSTGSGKSLAFWLPALTAVRAGQHVPAADRGRIETVTRRGSVLYLCPTKALAADQLSAVDRVLTAGGIRDIRVTTCDGDTAREERRWIADHADVVLTNPDFLHFALLPQHRRWSRLLGSLRYVVLDECHAFRGVFGAHVAAVLRRLRRLAGLYGADPVFLLASATTADPAASAGRLIGADPELIHSVHQDASPAGRKTIALWQPPELPGVTGPWSELVPEEDPWALPLPEVPVDVDRESDAGAGGGAPPQETAADGTVEGDVHGRTGAATGAVGGAAAGGGVPGVDEPSAAGGTESRGAAGGTESRGAVGDAEGHGPVGTGEDVVAEDTERPRRSATAETAELLADLTAAGARSLAFTRSRRAAESVATVTREHLRPIDPGLAAAVAAYRGGYLPEERRELEEAIRTGRLRALATTNALELGVDISGLDAVVIAGWPGTRVSLWQQAGRAGRAGADGLVILVAREDPLDTYVVHHPEAVLDAPVEATVFDPGNPYVLAPHLCAAAAETPLRAEELDLFGPHTRELLDVLVAQGALRRRPSGWYWTHPEQATRLTDLRGTGGDPVRVVESSTGRLLGTVDAASADSTVHDGAVYVHQGAGYVVSELNLADGVALAERRDVDYGTWSRWLTTVEIQETTQEQHWGPITWGFGVVDVTTQVMSYQRKRIPDLQVLGAETLDLPARTLRTTAVWWTAPAEVLEQAGVTQELAPGALHAAEHASIGLLPLLATCDRWDLGGVSTAMHADTEQATVFVHDAYPGGAGFAERGFDLGTTWLRATRDAVATCPCRTGCPACVQSPKCGNGNNPLEKAAAVRLLDAVLSHTG
ncbi:DEAD/DEAH box helicase [Cellulomonas denverensis]|uniref:DEAD/DEAH box helicase n=1 Tax=Cellulomonas denverensis TaxID=264297 RepID=A0A7X6QY25_9CELL|nr:DEAD/DEAH box helicase [Cellulomonas denverensis]NKY21683.1 DEAD/DEAH box helicase [Cellulomonas denverensis]GIG25659.1 DEAD/DEAH box helicase [Cellulomonas denverensis]